MIKSPKGVRKVLVVDVGGTHIKTLATGQKEKREIPSGPKMTARQMVADVKQITGDWKYDVVSIGYPGPAVHGRPFREPYNLGGGWVGFNFGKEFGHPVKLVNDAAMQALGAYRGGRMLFLGLGTGLGATLILDGTVEPMEIGHMPYKRGRTFEDYAGERGRERLGNKKWRKAVDEVVTRLKEVLEVDYVVLGGGNALRLKGLPEGVRLGDNLNAFKGGLQLWREAPPGSKR